MTSTTTNYNLTLYDATTDAGELFLDYRVDMCGTTGSNMTKLDAALTAIQVSIDALELSKGATFVNASFDSGSLYTATGISGITAYDTNLKIILQLDQDSDGTVTLNINSLGVKSVYYINNAGTATNLVGAHLKNNREYYLRYNGTVFVVVSDTENPSVWTMNTETLAATKTLTDYSESIQYLDPGGSNRDIELPAEADSNPIFIIVNRADAAENLVVKDDSPATILTLNENETGMFIGNGVAWKGFLIEDANTYLQNVVEDTSPQLGGDLDLNGNSIDFPTTANVSDVLDEDDMVSDSATKLVTQQSLKAYVDNKINPNILINGGFDVWQEGTSFTAATTPANDNDTYLVDQWILLSDGNDIIDVQKVTDGVNSEFSLGANIETINKKWAFFQPLEFVNSPKLGDIVSLSLKLQSVASNIRNMRAAVISWDGTKDAITSDIISAWAVEGTNPTLAANWTYENIAIDLAVSAANTTFEIPNIEITTSGVSNVGVLFWMDDTDAALTNLLDVDWVKLEYGAVCTPYIPKGIAGELVDCQRYFERLGEDVAYQGYGAGFIDNTTDAKANIVYTEKRVQPAISFSAVTDFEVWSSTGGVVQTTGMGATNIGNKSCNLAAVVAAGLTAGEGCLVLGTNTTTHYIDVSSRL